MRSPNVSVVIPTFNGAKKIVSLLEALSKQSNLAFKTYIVIDGSTDDSVKRIKERTWNFEFEIIEQENQGRSIARNNGANSCKEGLIIFFDDDLRPEPNCIQRHVDHYLKYSNSILVGAPLSDPKKSKSDFWKYKIHLENLWTEKFQHEVYKVSIENFIFSSANFSIPQNLFLQLKGFDYRLKDAEDYDLGQRSLKEGIEIYYDHTLICWHDDFLTCKSYIKRQREYHQSHKVLESLKISNTLGHEKQSKLKDIIYFMLSSPCLVKIIDSANLLIVLPQSIRFKLYSIIIWGLATKFPDRKI